MPPLTTVLPFAAPWPYRPSDTIWITDGPDYPLEYLLRLARSRPPVILRGKGKGPRHGKRGPQKSVPPDDRRCVAVVPTRDPLTMAPTGEKHRCLKPARGGPYCLIHRHLLTPAPAEGTP